MTKQGAIKACMTSPDVCVADVNNFSIMEKERERGKGGGLLCSIISNKMSNKGQQCKHTECEGEHEGMKRRDNVIVY